MLGAPVMLLSPNLTTRLLAVSGSYPPCHPPSRRDWAIESGSWTRSAVWLQAPSGAPDSGLVAATLPVGGIAGAAAKSVRAGAPKRAHVARQSPWGPWP